MAVAAHPIGNDRTPPRLVVRLFGALEVEDGGRLLGPGDLGGSRPKQVLEILLAARGHHVPTERIAELLWGDRRPGDVAGSIQTFVSVLRRHLVPDRDEARRLVVTEAEAYRVATDRFDLDLDRFDELLERSSREPTAGARRLLAEALSLARGEVLEDEPYTSWAQDLRGSYQGRVLGARLDAAEAALAELDPADALAHAEAAIGLDRFSERAQRTTVLALHALGRQHEALARYRAFRRLLDEELGLEPTAETRALELAILRQDDPRSLLPRPIGARAPATPSLDAARPARLLGRDEELSAVVAGARTALDGDLLLIRIEGDSGFGKTRLLEELERELRGVRSGRAGCSILERHLPYVPLAAALRDANVCPRDHAERLPALAAVFPEVAVGDEKREHAEVDVLEALVALIDHHAPILLCLDDLHRADEKTIAAIGYLRRRGRGRRAALVLTSSPAEVPPGHPLRGLAPDVVVRLEPLTAEELEPLAIPDLHASTGGHPGLVADVVRRGRTGPSPLVDALLDQCRSEGPWGYRVLSTASLLEQPFAPEPLAELLDADAAELGEELERLCERRILRVDGLRFRFRYDLVRQALVESVSPARRQLLRRRLPAAATAPNGSAAVRLVSEGR